MTIEIKQKIEKIRKELRDHDYAYYILNQPEISDKEYDLLLRQLKALEDQYPQYKTDNSPTVRVGGGVISGFKTVEHKQKLLSLDNAYLFDEIKDWDTRLKKGLVNQKIEYALELKIDGVSANITYKKGRILVGATRGDGSIGEDVTENIKTISSIPLVLRGDFPEVIEIRGEVYMSNQTFIMLNKQRKENGETFFANPRNAAAGTMKLLDTSIVRKRKLNFFAHSLGEYKGSNITTQHDFLLKLKKWGLRTNPHFKLCKNLEQVFEYCQYWQDKKEELDYQTDGIVIKVNDISQQESLGATLKSPRWAIAYKFPAQQATTEVLKINLQVGRTGVITPVAELKPVECAGVIIKHATLHNFDEIGRLNVKVGDRILIERAGEVIPKVIKVVKAGNGKKFSIPKNCPVCREKLAKEEGEVALRCINPTCPAQAWRALVHFASRGAMDIEGLGEAVVEQLISNQLIKEIADIYFLKKEDLISLELFKEKRAENLLRGIEESKKRPLSSLIYALGIRHVGEKAAYVLAQSFGTMDNLSKAKVIDLESIHEIGRIMASSIVDFFKQSSNQHLISRLKSAGLSMQEKVTLKKNSALFQKRIVFTGELKSFSRTQAEQLVREHGGTAVSSVSKKTDFVVTGDNPGSKFEKAKKLGVKIINEEEFSALIRSEGV